MPQFYWSSHCASITLLHNSCNEELLNKQASYLAPSSRWHKCMIMKLLCGKTSLGALGKTSDYYLSWGNLLPSTPKCRDGTLSGKTFNMNMGDQPNDQTKCSCKHWPNDDAGILGNPSCWNLKRFLHRSNQQLCHAVSSARVTKLRLP